jgi:host factor-I protein
LRSAVDSARIHSRATPMAASRWLLAFRGDLLLMPETKTGAPNIQDVFLNYARREKLPVTLHLLDGREFEARIKNFDRFALIVEHAGMDHLIFKHAIATIRTPRSVPNYFSSHHP